MAHLRAVYTRADCSYVEQARIPVSFHLRHSWVPGARVHVVIEMAFSTRECVADLVVVHDSHL
jgi:hypothetical protein